jgi:hypothetical protein
MRKDEAIAQMIAPGTRRPGKFRTGVMQLHITRTCDLGCSNCTQGSQFGGKPEFISLANLERALQSMGGYFGVIGFFGGNCALAPEFEQMCELALKYFPQEQLGVWCNHPRGKGSIMRKTFNPAYSNLNCHLKQEAYDEFKRDWPESHPFGLDKDSRHSPVHGNMSKFIPEESERWKLISNCPINRHWSAMLCQFRGELRAFFCEIAGSQAILNQHNPDYPDTGMQVTLGWWRKPMQDFENQVEFHCHRCLVPLNGHGALAQQEHVTTVTEEYSHLKLKGSSHQLQILGQDDDIHSESTRKVVEYLGR